MNTQVLPRPSNNVRAASPVRIRPGHVADAEKCAAICHQAFADVSGRHGFPPEISAQAVHELMGMLFTRPDVSSFIAERDGEIVGSNFLWTWRPIPAIGPLTVVPIGQDAAVGRRLMEAALNTVNEMNAAGVRLVQATYNMRSMALYTKLGFQVRELLACFQGAPVKVSNAAHTTRKATTSDIDACLALCARVLGHERREELLDAVGRGVAIVAEKNGRVVAYTTTVGFFSHAVAEDNEALKALIAAAETFPGPGFLVPMRNTELFRWCLDNGLRLVQPMTLMTRGEYTEPRGAYLPSVLL